MHDGGRELDGREEGEHLEEARVDEEAKDEDVSSDPPYPPRIRHVFIALTSSRPCQKRKVRSLLTDRSCHWCSAPSLELF